MDSKRIAAQLMVVMVIVSSSAFAQGKSAAAQNTTQQGTPFNQLQAQLAALEVRVETISQEVQALQVQIGQVENRLQAQIATINEMLFGLQAQVTAGAETTATLAARIEANEAAIAALTLAVATLQSQLTAVEAFVAGNIGDISALQSHVTSLQTLITAHTSQMAALQQQTTALEQFQTNLANGSCATGAAIQDVASGGFIVCTQSGGGAMQTLTRTVSSTLFTGTTYLSVGCPAGYVATGAGFTVPAAVESQHYVTGVNFATQTISSGFRNVPPINVVQSTTNGSSATVQVQYLPQTYYSGYFVQVQATCARVQ
jgi:peptidoglycan hydrolase CwlO-like protein